MVSKENLGEKPGLIAGGSLLVDYILTVAVSISAGTDAITSAFPPAPVSFAHCCFACNSDYDFKFERTVRVGVHFGVSRLSVCGGACPFDRRRTV